MIHRFFMVLAGAGVLGAGSHTLWQTANTPPVYPEMASLNVDEPEFSGPMPLAAPSVPETDLISPTWLGPEYEPPATSTAGSPTIGKAQNGRSSLTKKASAFADTPHASGSVPTKSVGSGLASVYAYGAGKTASGEHSRASGFTAAHRTLPFGTMVRVTNRRNGRSVVVRINDRGPFLRSRVIDITPAAASALGFSGLAPVSLSVVSKESRGRDG